MPVKKREAKALRKEQNPEKEPQKRSPRKLKTLDLGALIAFNQVKAWVKENEPEHYGAFKPKRNAKRSNKRK